MSFNNIAFLTQLRFMNVHHSNVAHSTHLSKDTSGCKQKCTQFLTLFSGTVFHTLSHGVICFAQSVSPRNHFLTGGNSLTANQRPLLRCFLKLTLRTKWITPCERASKTVPENGVRNCVHFYLRPLERPLGHFGKM